MPLAPSKPTGDLSRRTMSSPAPDPGRRIGRGPGCPAHCHRPGPVAAAGSPGQCACLAGEREGGRTPCGAPLSGGNSLKVKGPGKPGERS